jgi:Carboxypeptidase regulatory-like domain
MHLMLNFLFLLYFPTTSQKVADATVVGTVVDPNGRPVEGSMVYAFTDGSSPPGQDQTVTTDEKGNFVLAVYPGRVLLFAYKEDDLYHKNMFRFDVPSGTPENQPVEVESRETVRGVVVHLPRKSGLLRFDVQNANTNGPVSPFQFELCRGDHAGDPIYCLTGSAQDSSVEMVVPPDPVSIKITAPDYLEWRYRDSKTGSAYIALKSMESRTLTVHLRPITKK